MCHFRKHHLPKNDQLQKPPVDKVSPFHRVFSQQDFVYKICLFSCPLRDLTFYVFKWYIYHMVAIGLVTPSLTNGKVITYILLVVVIATS